MIRKVEFKNDSLVTYLQGLSIETDARRDLISFMIANNMDISTEQFQKYQKEYNEFYGEFALAKDQLEQLIKKDYLEDDEELVFWNLDFNSSELELTVEKK